MFSRSQRIVIGIVGSIIFFFGLVFTGVIPGLRVGPEDQLKAELSVWGVEESSIVDPLIKGFNAVYPGVKVSYKKVDSALYESSLVDALAAGNGPDVFVIDNTWVPKHYNKLYPVPEAMLTLQSFRELFPRIAEQDFAADGVIFSLPLYIDTLALFYNKDIFDNEGIVAPPRDWQEVINLIPRLRALTSLGRIERAAIALGGSKRSIDNMLDIISTLMLQSGTEMVSDDFTQATFANAIGKEAFNFYLKFSDPKNAAYTWNDSVGSALNAFADQRTAMLVHYEGALKYVKTRNPFLRIGIASFPQPRGVIQSVAGARYLGLSVSHQTQYPEAALRFVLHLATEASALKEYMRLGNHSPALRTLIAEYGNNGEAGVFAKQALIARSWPQVDSEKTADIFSQAVSAVLGGRLPGNSALEEAEARVTSLMNQRAQ